MNNNGTLRITMTLLCILFGLTTAFAAPAKQKLKVGYAPGGGSILAFIAQDQKLFAKEGIEVELVQFSSSGDGLNALNSGKIDIGISFGTAAPLTFITKGSDFTIIGGALAGGHPVIALQAKAGQFKSIQDFKGKTVATPRLYTADVVWRGALKRAGIDPNKDVKIIELKNPPAVLEAVKSGKVDVGIGASSIYLQAKESGLAIVQLTELVIQKTSPLLHQVLGIYLPLITTNCAVLGIPLLNVSLRHNFLESLLFGFGSAVGFTLALVLFAGIRERLEAADVPVHFRGTAIAMITAGLMSLAFMGFAGLDKYK